jgi:hypothetical protein
MRFERLRAATSLVIPTPMPFERFRAAKTLLSELPA